MVNFRINRDDWSLYRKPFVDVERHRKKVFEALKRNLAELLCDESLILEKGKKLFKIPVQSMEEYCFRYNLQQIDYIGQGQGNTKEGKILSAIIEKSDNYERGKLGGGTLPGVDYYEVDITVEDLEDILYKELKLPNLQEKDRNIIEEDTLKFKGTSRVGPFANLDKKKTILENIKRNPIGSIEIINSFIPEDLRFNTWEKTEEVSHGAVVFAMMDVSGSMGTQEKYSSRSFFFWMTRFLRTYYKKVEIIFLAHHTEAKQVEEHEFFTKGESGGTRCSSVYKLVLDLIDNKYTQSEYNIYAFHFSDGDNLPSDNAKCRALMETLIGKCNLVGYGEIANPYYKTGTLMDLYKPLCSNKKFVSVIIKDRTDVHLALKKFFSG